MEDEFLKVIHKRTAKNTIIGLIVLGTVWGVIISFMGPGTGTAVVNIFFMILSILISIVLLRSLRYFMNELFAYGISIVLWILIFMIYRAFIANIF